MEARGFQSVLHNFFINDYLEQLMWTSRSIYKLTEIIYIHTAQKGSEYRVFLSKCFPVFSLNTGKYGPEKTPYLDSLYAVSPINQSKTKLFCHLQYISEQAIHKFDSHIRFELNLSFSLLFFFFFRFLGWINVPPPPSTF